MSTWTWLSGLTLNAWAQIGSNTANNVDPKDDAAINGSYPSSPAWANGYDLTDVASQWNGGALDDVNGVFWTGGGGHSGYYGNELYSINLEADAPAWIRRGYPSGSIQKPCASFTSDGANQSLLPDGRPHSVHNYNLFCAINNGDVALAPGGFKYDGTATWYGFKFDSTTNDWVTGTLLDSNYATYGSACYDPVRDKLWVFDHQYLTSINLSTGVCTTHFNTQTDAVGEYSKMVYDSTRDIFVVFLDTQASSAYGNAYVLYFDPDNPSAGFIKAIQDNTVLRGRMGVAYDPDGDRYLCWNGGADLTVITPPATGWNTNTWTSSTLTLSGTPSSAATGGTYGRFQYSSKYGCAFLLNTLGEKLWAVKLFESGPPPQVLAPVSDVSDGAWTPSTGTDLFACVDEATYSDTDYIAATTATTCELAFAAGTDPASSVGHALKYRLLSGSGAVTVALKQGASTIASFGPHTLTGVVQAMQQALSGGQADSITDYAALSVAITAAAPAGITYVGGQVGGRVGATSTSNVTFALTGGSDSTPQAGDLVIIGCTIASAGRTPACAISGYTAQTQINANGTTYDTSLNMSYKFMGGTPDTTFTLPSTGNNQDAQRYTVQVWRGVDATTPLDVAVVPASGTATGRPNPGAITPATAGAKVGIIGAGAAATGASYTAPANYTTGFLTGTTADTNDAMIGAGWRSWTSGAEDPAAFTGGTTNAADSWAAFTYALRPKAIDAKVSWISFQTPEAVSGALAAAASGTALASGSATLAGQIALAAVGVATAGGSATAGVAVPLSSAGIATAGGSANRSAAITISAAGLAQAAGQAGLAVAVQVAAAGAAAATGNATLAGQIVLATAGAAQAAGNATLAAQLAAIADGAAHASGSANLTGGAGGALSATGGASASGSATLVAQIAAVAAGLATAAGSANAGAKIAAGASGTATAAGAAAAGAQVAAVGSGAATAAGNAALRAQLAAVAAGGSLAGGSAALVTLFAAFASALAHSAGSATAGIGRAASAPGSAQASGQGTLSVFVSLAASGNSAASGNAAGNLQAAGGMHAAGQAQSGGSAVPSVLARIVAAGYSAATGSAGGSLTTSLAGEAHGANVSTGSAQIDALAEISAAAFVEAIGSGALIVDVPLAASGQSESSGSAEWSLIPIYAPATPLRLVTTVGRRLRLRQELTKPLHFRQTVSRKLRIRTEVSHVPH